MIQCCRNQTLKKKIILKIYIQGNQSFRNLRINPANSFFQMKNSTYLLKRMAFRKKRLMRSC